MKELSKSQGLVAANLFLKKQHFFPFYIVSFLHFKTKIPKKKDVMRGDINFLFSFFSVLSAKLCPWLILASLLGP
jgi:hypothetical protein